eukprot:TRINITY_DN21204_c0_g1_i2.p1 TRINITY_DN21204_c0_g1~~TRINITY_DN21204_c0_g1_i2.p1  ORF type:complete len:875 (+),score=194.79 TRINITY_DN21204_c0_g1_i2:25-2625(+)
MKLKDMPVWEVVDELMLGAKEGNIDVVNKYLPRCVELEAVDNKDDHGFSCLAWAVWNKHLDAAAALIEAGADVNTLDDDSQTPLFNAAYSGSIDLVHLLLASGADISIPDSEGETPFAAASSQGHLAVVEILASAGADPLEQDTDGLTALHKARAKGFTPLTNFIQSYVVSFTKAAGKTLKVVDGTNNRPSLHLPADCFSGSIDQLRQSVATRWGTPPTALSFGDGTGRYATQPPGNLVLVHIPAASDSAEIWTWPSSRVLNSSWVPVSKMAYDGTAVQEHLPEPSVGSGSSSKSVKRVKKTDSICRSSTVCSEVPSRMTSPAESVATAVTMHEAPNEVVASGEPAAQYLGLEQAPEQTTEQATERSASGRSVTARSLTEPSAAERSATATSVVADETMITDLRTVTPCTDVYHRSITETTLAEGAQPANEPEVVEHKSATASADQLSVRSASQQLEAEEEEEEVQAASTRDSEEAADSRTASSSTKDSVEADESEMSREHLEEECVADDAVTESVASVDNSENIEQHGTSKAATERGDTPYEEVFARAQLRPEESPPMRDHSVTPLVTPMPAPTYHYHFATQALETDTPPLVPQRLPAPIPPVRGHSISLPSSEVRPDTACGARGPPTPLHEAAVIGELCMAEYLLSLPRADVNVLDPKGRTPLIWACIGGQLPLVKLLMSSNANHAIRDADGCTALFHAAVNGKNDVLRWFGENVKGNNFHLLDNEGHSMAQWAAYKGYLSTLRYLYEVQKVRLDIPDYEDRLAIHWAARMGKCDVLRYLIEKGSAVFLKDKKGLTAEDHAIEKQQWGAVTVLREARILVEGGSQSDEWRHSISRAMQACSGIVTPSIKTLTSSTSRIQECRRL